MKKYYIKLDDIRASIYSIKKEADDEALKLNKEVKEIESDV